MKTVNTLASLLMLSLLFSACQRVESDGVTSDVKEAPIIRLCDDISQDGLLVKFVAVPKEDQLNRLSEQQGIRLQRLFPSTPGKEAVEAKYGLDRWYEAELEEGSSVETKAQDLSRISSVASVEYIGQLRSDAEASVEPFNAVETKATGSSFNDPQLNLQWNYKNFGNPAYGKYAVAGADVNVFDVWANLTCGDPSIIVAVVDQGVKYNHPDLQENMWVNTKEIPGNGIDDDGNGYIDDVYGYNFVDKGPITWALGGNDGDSGHGTHCAGTIAAVNNNGKGVAGIAGGSGKVDGCRIMSCQVFSAGGGGSVSVMVKAVKYAADMGASIISCSLGYKVSFPTDNAYISSQGTAEIDVIHYFEDAANANNDVLTGNIAIFSAGNDHQDFCHYPGAFVDIISVSAFGSDGLPTYYTNYGPGCNISAPGGEFYMNSDDRDRSMILSTVPKEIYGSDYGYMQGTSMACPHVSGVVALGLSYAHQLGKKFDRDEFKRMILSSVNDIDQRIGSTKEKTYVWRNSLDMAPYYHQMGTGMIDAWRLMMKIEGTPSLTAQTGRKQWIDLSPAFGSASVSLTYLAVEVPETTIESIGLQKITGATDKKYPSIPDTECYAYVQYGRLYIHPTKVGSGKIIVKAVGGGDHLGGGNNPTGGMEIEQEISLIARVVDGGNGMGGWL